MKNVAKAIAWFFLGVVVVSFWLLGSIFHWQKLVNIGDRVSDFQDEKLL